MADADHILNPSAARVAKATWPGFDFADLFTEGEPYSAARLCHTYEALWHIANTFSDEAGRDRAIWAIQSDIIDALCETQTANRWALVNMLRLAKRLVLDFDEERHGWRLIEHVLERLAAVEMPEAGHG